MAELRDTDQFLVNRNNTSGQIPTSKLMAELLSDDLMIVNREDVTYKITGQEVIDSISDIANPDINDILVDGVPPTQDGTIDDPVLLTPITVGERGGTGQTVEVITIQNQTEGKYLLFIDENAGDNGDRFAQPVPKFDATGRIDTRLDYFDNPPSNEEEIYAGLLKTGSVYFSWDVTQMVAIPPDISAVVLSENNPEGDRFTAESFTTVVTMAEEGLPVATKGIQGWVEGLLEAQATTDEIIKVDTELTYNYEVRCMVSNKDGSTLDWTSGTNSSSYPVGNRPPIEDNVASHTLMFYAEGNVGFTYGLGNDGYCNSGAGTLEAWESDTGGVGTWELVASGTLQQFGVMCDTYSVPASSKKYFAIIRKDVEMDKKNYFVTGTINSTVLTFAGDKDIAQFGEGDSIQQNSDYTPNTSEIISITETEIPTWSGMSEAWTGSGTNLSPQGGTTGVIPVQLPKTGIVYWEVKLTVYENLRQLGIYFENPPAGAYTDNSCTIYFNGSGGESVMLGKNQNGSSAIGSAGKHGGKIVSIPDTTSHLAGIQWKVNDIIGFIFNADLGQMWISRNGEWLAEQTFNQTYPNARPNPLTGAYPLWANIDTSQDLWFGSGYNSQFQVQTQPTSAYAPKYPALVVTDDKDLENLRVGDDISQDSLPGVLITKLVDSVNGGIWDEGAVLLGTDAAALAQVEKQNYCNNDINDNNKLGNKGIYLHDPSHYIEFTYSNASVGDEIEIVCGSGSGNIVSGNWTLAVEGDVDETGTSVIFLPINSQGKNGLPKVSTKLTASATSGTIRLTRDVDGSQFLIYYTEGLGALPTGTIGDITGTTLTLSESNGTWSANTGNYAIGPNLGQPNGIVGSSDFINNTITLVSSENGRWAVNAGKYCLGELDIPVENLTPISDEIISYGNNVVTPPATALESKTFKGADFPINEGPVINNWDFSKATNRPSGPLTLGEDWGDSGQMFAVRFDNPTMVVGGRNSNAGYPSVAMALVSSDDGINWTLEDYQEATPVFSDPDSCLRGKSRHLYWGIHRYAPVNGPLMVNPNMDGVYSFGALSSIETSLTFASDKDLENFSAGDDVYQDSGHTPTTSVIIEVGDNLNGENHYELRSAGGTTWSARPSVNTASFVEDVQIGNPSVASGSSSFLVFAFDAPVSNVLIGRTATVAQGISVFGINDANSTAWEWIATQSLESNSYIDTGSTQYQYYMLIRTPTLPDPFNDNWYESGSIHNNTTYTSYGILANTKRTKLTLTDDTDLENLRADDTIRQDSYAADVVFKDICDSAKAWANGRIRYLDNQGVRQTIKPITDDGIQILIGSGSWIQGSTVSDSYLTIDGDSSLNIADSNYYPKNNEDYILEFECSSVTPFTIGWRTNSGGSDTTTIEAVANCTLSGTTSTTGSTTVETVVTPSGPGLVKINFVSNSVNKWMDFGINFITGVASLPVGIVEQVSGNTVTMSEVYGTFTAGNYAIGPDTTPATGTVASTDPATNTMTLSVSDESGTKRWIANQDKTVIGPSRLVPKESRLYLVMDENLLVSDFTATEPDYIEFDGDNCQIDFPTVLPSGETPDQRLPEGTTMRTRVIAANTAGTDVMTSNRITPIASIGPNATMHGLRFDSARKTNLSLVQAPVTDFTLSAWVKNTGDAVEAMILGQKVESAAEFISYYINKSSRNLTVYEKPDNKSLGTNVSVPLNQWTHVLFKCESNIVTGYVNGVAANSPVTLTKGYQVDRFAIGRALSDDTNYMDGYLSDIYFVDGQALEPTTFGADFEGKWGPLNSNIVKANVGDFGSSGFYLPFDSAAQGANYSNGVTADAAFNSSYPLINMFDGNEVTFASTSPTNSGGVVDFGTKFPAGSGPYDVEVFKVSETSSLTINGAGPTRVGAQAAYNYWDGVDSIPEITWDNAGSFGARYIKVNGKILMDYNSIGVDASGNDNHFHDQNFVFNDGVIYSESLSSTGTGAFTNAHYGFNGNFAQAAGKFLSQAHTPGSLIFSPPSPITVASLEVYILGWTTATYATAEIHVNGSKIMNVPDSSNGWVSVNFTGELSSISVTGKYVGATSHSLKISGYKINGKVLVDANYADTVFDTPMNSYAVLETGTDGNLKASANGTNVTYMGEAGKDYYYERNGVSAVHTGGTAFNSKANYVYNFGQQPFADSSEYDSSEQWSTMLSCSGAGTVQNPTLGFNGDLTTSTNYSGGDNGQRLIFTPANKITFTDKVEMYTGSSANVSLYWKVEGSPEQSACLGVDNVIDWKTGPTGGGVLEYIAVARDGCDGRALSSSAFFAIRVDGKILVDPGSAIIDSRNNTLSQTWLEWNNVAVLLADNPANVATYEAIKEALETYQGDKVSFQRNLRARMLQAGFGVADVVSLGLVDDTENAKSINGYYPLYSTMKAAQDAGSGAAHSHIIDGVTYYMPDAGVTIYHGNHDGDTDGY